MPEDEPANPERRAERVAAQANTAPKRVAEDRTRSVSVNRDAVKQEAKQYLRQQYTSADGQMICQVCKDRLPFQLEDGTEYFERVELMGSLKRHHKENYLALCPNHAAMYQHANGSPENLNDVITEICGNSLRVVLAKQETTIYFTKKHLADLKAIIRADGDITESSEEAAADDEPANSDKERA